ncbi:MAG: MBL fold metallo-hydrolase [Leptospira sp.]|nr:MBL fold metallo-hydrolase [Leptospira sp.]
MDAKFSYKGFEFNGISEGGIRTSIGVPRFKLMFDIGSIHPDRIHFENLLLTHGHLDHSAGIPYFVSQRSLQKLKPANIYVHESVFEPLNRILKIYSEMEGFDYPECLKIARENEPVELSKNFFFKPLKTFHRIPSQGYTIFEKTKKLKSEFSGFSDREIMQKKIEGESVTEDKDVPMVSFSGDTKIEYVLEHKDVAESKILFLECTYIDEERNVERARLWGHIHLDEIVAYANEFKNEKIVLIHFSKRYSFKYISEMIRKKIPKILSDRIHLFLPERNYVGARRENA